VLYPDDFLQDEKNSKLIIKIQVNIILNQIGISIENNMKKISKKKEFVHSIEIIKGFPFYGFCNIEKSFMKIKV
jgi:hypothetical protein